MTIYNTPNARTGKPHFSIPALLAIAAAIGSFVVSPGFGFMLAIFAIILGVIGFFLAFAPSIRGGMTSMLSIAAGLLGVVGAIIRLIF